MISISLHETPLSRCQQFLKSFKYSGMTLRKSVLGFVLFALSFVGNSQTVSISSSVTGAVEGTGSTIDLIVSLNNGVINNTGADITGTIGYAGTAISGADYIDAMFFAIPNGVNSTIISLVIIDDALCEPSESIIATISSVSVGSINPISSSVTLTIFDDDCGSILISLGSPVDGVEGSSDITFDVFIEGGAINITGAPITGTIAYPVAGATPIADFIPVDTFAILNGANSTTITLPVIDDIDVESTELVIATLTGVPSIGSYANVTTTANIIDDDASNLTISIGSPVDATEGISDISFVVYLENGAINNTGSPITGFLNLGGTASSSDILPALPGFAILDGENTDTIVVSVLDDACIEFTETVIATISNPSVGSINIDVATANIFDDDMGVATISIGSPVDGEEGISDVQFTVFLDNGLLNCSGVPITGTVFYSGTATDGVDYTSVVSFTIPDGSSSVDLLLAVIDDTLYECDETVLATIGSPNVGAISTNDTSTAIIFDNECINSIDPISDHGLEIFPNPVSSVINIRSEQQMESYVVLDLNGRVVRSGGVDSQELALPIESISNGIYVVEVQFDDGKIVRKKILKN